MQRYGAFALDLGWAALSPFLALLIRDNFVAYPPSLEAISSYAAIAVAAAAPAFIISGTYKTLWRYTSLTDALRVLLAAAAAILLALFIGFVTSRLEGVSRSVPVIQWFLLVGTMVGSRVAVRIWYERTTHGSFVPADRFTKHALIVGTTSLTELYLRSVAEYGSAVKIVGLVSSQREFHGRLLRRQKVLGTLEQFPEVIRTLDVHGIAVEQIVVMHPFEELSRPAAEALLAMERGSDVEVHWMVERLGLKEASLRRENKQVLAHDPTAPHSYLSRLPACETTHLSLGRYGPSKRGLDIAAALLVSALLAPLLLAVGLLVSSDVGLPLVFWQQRLGRFGRSFKLFKFCTMRAAHDTEGNRIPDEQRLTTVGRLLQRGRLDELPQLYNVLIGEMSFVGPRPLLPLDQPEAMESRLSVRPGLTGFAQVHGGRLLSAEEKNTLDIWYIQNASLWLDIKILLQTVTVLIRGDRVDRTILRAAQHGLERQTAESTVGADTRALPSKSVVRGGEAAITKLA